MRQPYDVEEVTLTWNAANVRKGNNIGPGLRGSSVQASFDDVDCTTTDSDSLTVRAPLVVVMLDVLRVGPMIQNFVVCAMCVCACVVRWHERAAEKKLVNKLHLSEIVSVFVVRVFASVLFGVSWFQTLTFLILHIFVSSNCRLCA